MTKILTYGTTVPSDGCRTPKRKRPPSGGRLSLLYRPCPGDVGSSGLCHTSGERGTPSAALSAWPFVSCVVTNMLALDGRTAISYSLVYDGFGKQCTPISILAAVRLWGA